MIKLIIRRDNSFIYNKTEIKEISQTWLNIWLVTIFIFFLLFDEYYNPIIDKKEFE